MSEMVEHYQAELDNAVSMGNPKRIRDCQRWLMEAMQVSGEYSEQELLEAYYKATATPPGQAKELGVRLARRCASASRSANKGK